MLLNVRYLIQNLKSHRVYLHPKVSEGVVGVVGALREIPTAFLRPIFFLLLRTLEFEKDLKYTADKLQVSYRMETSHAENTPVLALRCEASPVLTSLQLLCSCIVFPV